MPIRTLIILLLAASALVGCGRRGDLEPPNAVTQTKGDKAPPASGISPLDPGSDSAEPPPPPAEAPKKHFFLDFLI
jgi:predicted small lipoprotein YifL